MGFLVAIALLAVILGAAAPAVVRKRPRVALAVVVMLPPLLLLVQYISFARAHDWEGMGLLALLIVSSAWIVLSLSAGAAVLVMSRRFPAAREER